MNINRYLLSTILLIANIYAMETPRKSFSTADSFSPNAYIKYCAIERTEEFKQLEKAKIAHQTYNTADTEYILNLSQVELTQTKEYQELLHAVEETHVLTNIGRQTNNERYAQKSTYDLSVSSYEQESKLIKIATQLKKESDTAWSKVCQTREFQLYQKAQLAHQKHNTTDTLSLLRTSESLLAETKHTQDFSIIQKQLDQVLAEFKKYTTSVIDPICLINTDQDETYIPIIEK